MSKRFVFVSCVSATVTVTAWVGGAGWVRADADPTFETRFEVPAAKPGQRAVVKLHVNPPAGYHLNKEFPTSLAFTPPAGVTTEKAKLVGQDAKRFDEQNADFEIPVVSTAAGKQVVAGDLKFGVCSPTACIPTRKKVSFTLEVK